MTNLALIRTDAPIERVETVQRFDCAICKIIGQEDYPDASDWSDLYGKSFPYAQMTPTGAWVCSRACLSQLMFNSSTEHGQEILKRYQFALAELEEVIDEVTGIIDPWDCGSVLDSHLFQNAQRALGSRARRWHGKEQAPPIWIHENHGPAEPLKKAIREALFALDYRVRDWARLEVGFQLDVMDRAPTATVGITAPYTTGKMARILGSLATIITNLKTAVGQ